MAKTKLRKARKRLLYEGLPVVDAPIGARLKITVTPEDVKNSKSNDPAHCAAALAASEEYRTDVRVHLSRTYVLDRKKKQWVRFITPEAISREIVAFDRARKFEPGEYEVVAAPNGNRLGRDAGWGGTKREVGKRGRPIHVTANVRPSARECWRAE